MRGRALKSLNIVLLSIFSAIAYGTIHDQFTARICIEYFTIGHPPLVNTQDPTLLGIAWGIVATWWVGVGLGIPLAIAARAGSRPKRDARSLARPILTLLGFMGACAVVAGVIGGTLARSGSVTLQGFLATQVPDEKHIAFMIDWWAHSASYLSGVAGGIVVIILVWRSRGHKKMDGNPAA